MDIEYYKNKFQKKIDYIEDYRNSSNASTGSKYDANANVEQKNITTMSGEIVKEDNIGINRLLMINKLTELYDIDTAKEYIRQLESHEIYKHDETSIMPYCVSVTLYPFLFSGLKNIGGISDAPKNLKSFCGSFSNLVFAIASQFAGAVSTPEFLMYMDYFIRKEYGDDYIYNIDKPTTSPLVKKQKTIRSEIDGYFQQVVYSLNQPAAARNFQSVFWNIAYFDKNYFKGMFDDFIFPDYSEPCWETTNWLQKYFMTWFNEERLRKPLTFPVETVNLLDDGENYVDEEWADFTAEMYSKGHSFFTYRSDSVDSLSSCCFDGKQKTLTKSSNGVNYMTFEDLYNSNYKEHKRNFTIFHNGSWVKGKPIKLQARDMYKITTSNKKELFVTDNHIFPTLRGDIKVSDLTTDDYLMMNSRKLDTFPEKDKKLSYEQGYLVGMYLGDGSYYHKKETHTPMINLSINEKKYIASKNIIEKAILDIGEKEATLHLGTTYNNVYPTYVRSWLVCNFIREYVFGDYANEKELNLDCLLQSYEFRKGILDGYYMTDGGNSNRIYTTSLKLSEQIEVLCTSLGLNTVIDMTDRTDEDVTIRNQVFNRNYPLYCIRWYEPKNKRSSKNLFIVKNNCEYFAISNIEQYNSENEYVYCFEMENQNEPYFTLPNGVITHNCRLKNELQDNTFSFTLGAGGVSTGSKGVITININRLVQNSIKNNTDYSEDIRKQILKNHKYLKAFNEIIKDSFNSKLLPVFDAGYISLEKQYLTNGINGFVEGAEFLGIDISPNKEYFEYGEKILKPIYEENKKAKTSELMFNTEFVPAENLGVKNSKWDKQDGYFVPRDCYNSYFYKVEDENTNVLDKFILHGERLTKYLDGGSANHVNLEEHLTKEQYANLLKVAIKTGCSYFTFNIPNTVCNECEYISKRKLTICPNCGSSNLDYLTRVIGYLKRVSSFSEQRQTEERKRYYAKH